MVVMIPLVLYLVYYTSISKSKLGIRLGMKNMVVHWFIPVIAIPLLWPIQSIVDNQFGLWVSDVLLQSTRATEGIIAIFQSFISCRSSAHVTRVFGHSIQHIKDGIYHYALDFTIRVFFVNILYSVFSFDSCNTSLVHSSAFLIDRLMSIIRNLATRLIVQMITFTSILLFGLISTFDDNISGLIVQSI